MAEVDESLALRNLYHLGSLQQVVNDATNPATMPKSESSRKTRQVLLYRAYLAQGKFNMIMSEIPTSTTDVELLAIRIYAKLLATGGADLQGREDASNSIKELVFGGGGGVSATTCVLAASVLFYLGEYEEVLRAAVQNPRHLESVALAVQAYLKLDRLDLAKKEVAALKSWADDATLAQLVESWVNLVIAGEQKQQEAYYIFEELASSHMITAKLLNGQAVCRMHAGKFADAETLLLDALNRNNNDPEVLANLMVCSVALGKPSDVVSRYLNQLRDASPNHPFVLEYASKEAMFDRAAGRFAI
ncbi:hypothetical protein SmJEL517_g02877 [Synchytrium microbalum]|uniref:Coatomer subunit epsilon n=1 Tax=Synchytrium microbalum TaxID=1806994 RepID=A0A507C522_9FUNG|nr:uncharacterized protein SmJEL517_g02877 [Synchytrium microbalum]TPX34581.1 hypothetical protein SmJEL517_g02877 [Synchytrium microbalum]